MFWPKNYKTRVLTSKYSFLLLTEPFSISGELVNLFLLPHSDLTITFTVGETKQSLILLIGSLVDTILLLYSVPATTISSEQSLISFFKQFSGLCWYGNTMLSWTIVAASPVSIYSTLILSLSSFSVTILVTILIFS